MSTKDLDLSRMAPPKGSRRKKVRLGRGEASGAGKTCGRGGKGQKGRAGASIRPGFEGGQMPLYRRIPKLGFFSRKKTLGINVYEEVSVGALEEFEAGSTVDPRALNLQGLVSKNRKVKILGGGKLTKKLVLKVHAVTASARAVIEGLGGSIEVLARVRRQEQEAAK